MIQKGRPRKPINELSLEGLRSRLRLTGEKLKKTNDWQVAREVQTLQEELQTRLGNNTVNRRDKNLKRSSRAKNQLTDLKRTTPSVNCAYPLKKISGSSLPQKPKSKGGRKPGFKHSPETIAKITAKMKAKPKMSNNEKVLSKILRVLYPGDWKYVGNNEHFSLGGKRPDFFNVNGQKKVIEVYGFWHFGEDPQVKINHYAKFGFECLVLWEKDFESRPRLINKLDNFVTKIKTKGVPVTYGD
jgi:hypothetical protein